MVLLSKVTNLGEICSFLPLLRLTSASPSRPFHHDTVLATQIGKAERLGQEEAKMRHRSCDMSHFGITLESPSWSLHLDTVLTNQNHDLCFSKEEAEMVRPQ